jgi:DNA polymerase-3 subunit epsilon
LSGFSRSSCRTALPWPLAVIDFEASSLDQDGYPIEVGLAFWPSPDEAIYGWSTLIEPAGEWTRHGHWSPKSAKVHGISGRELLANGMPVDRVAARLNEMLGSERIAWCDGDAYDIHWTGELFKAAKATPLFHLGAWHRLLAMVGPTMRERGLEWLEQAPARHRAREDAEQLVRALAYAVGIESITVQDFNR